ncbi:polysaccharide deacetylase family protein [Marinigracilibium pacificum]|uniref:Polysaccharide deacetylase family protein n=1 Tax=Marinigracilibium pacificum TaxID=2729599 RepID=A0A848J590_9BACT|nr:polysaccharide deacetylase family protein [Marinigracilibium pacificum]NMM50876.1 polysaccharide deacetylase family protein [Marinigracilibium pacificum]
MRNILYLIPILLCPVSIFAQKYTAITIDDVPNTSKPNSELLSVLDSVNVPVSIFINEQKVYTEGRLDERKLKILEEWSSRDYVSLGNHGFSHQRYSTTGIDKYKDEVVEGERLTRELADKYGKELNEFRFPFNDLGKDSIQQKEIHDYLSGMGYSITPFSVESSDWMFSFLYNRYRKTGDLANARRIGEHYVTYTLDMFAYFDSLSNNDYNKNIKHIYLCHDNKLNADYLPEIIDRLQNSGYEIISLAEALEDPVYKQENYYHKKFGISWYYRWIADPSHRSKLMRSEPSIQDIYEEFEKFNNQ